jgi:hypothetical protein
MRRDDVDALLQQRDEAFEREERRVVSDGLGVRRVAVGRGRGQRRVVRSLSDVGGGRLGNHLQDRRMLQRSGMSEARQPKAGNSGTHVLEQSVEQFGPILDDKIAIRRELHDRSHKVRLFLEAGEGENGSELTLLMSSKISLKNSSNSSRTTFPLRDHERHQLTLSRRDKAGAARTCCTARDERRNDREVRELTSPARDDSKLAQPIVIMGDRKSGRLTMHSTPKYLILLSVSWKQLRMGGMMRGR